MVGPIPNEHYVSWAGGSRNGDGSRHHPYQTFQNALDGLVRDPFNGDRILVDTSGPTWWIRKVLALKGWWVARRVRRAPLIFRSYKE